VKTNETQDELVTFIQGAIKELEGQLERLEQRGLSREVREELHGMLLALSGDARQWARTLALARE
jgi:uncharacterized protein YhaN